MLTRWLYPDPFRDFDGLRRQLDQLFRDFDVGTRRRPTRAAWPRVNAFDTGTAFVIEAEVPGIPEDQLKIEATADSLTLSGKREPDAPEGYAVHRRERAPLEFTRSFALPAKIDLEQVRATAKHGLLTVTLPKKVEEQPRNITVKVS